ncbi:MAG: hypothetical protein M1825_002988 [Sarcosagium campestre]|nr:MAG: hypothetical protein M1825_002988 [Sarcosagium campestre]
MATKPDYTYHPPIQPSTTPSSQPASQMAEADTDTPTTRRRSTYFWTEEEKHRVMEMEYLRIYTVPQMAEVMTALFGRQHTAYGVRNQIRRLRNSHYDLRVFFDGTPFRGRDAPKSTGTGPGPGTGTGTGTGTAGA